MQRRHALGAALTGLAATGCASTMTTASAAASPFTVAQPSVPIAGSSEVFPVRRIYCIGRNYAAHAREMGSDPTREPPFFFQKPSDAVQFVAPAKTTDHPYPPLTKTTTTSWSWWRPCTKAAGTFPSTRPWTWSMATPSVST